MLPWFQIIKIGTTLADIGKEIYFRADNTKKQNAIGNTQAEVRIKELEVQNQQQAALLHQIAKYNQSIGQKLNFTLAAAIISSIFGTIALLLHFI